MSKPSKPFELSAADFRFLKSLLISPDDVCGTCDGKGRVSDTVTCRDCNKTGRTKYQPPAIDDGGCQ
jgi:hypothetical protein